MRQKFNPEFILTTDDDALVSDLDERDEQVEESLQSNGHFTLPRIQTRSMSKRFTPKEPPKMNKSSPKIKDKKRKRSCKRNQKKAKHVSKR